MEKKAKLELLRPSGWRRWAPSQLWLLPAGYDGVQKSKLGWWVLSQWLHFMRLWREINCTKAHTEGSCTVDCRYPEWAPSAGIKFVREPLSPFSRMWDLEPDRDLRVGVMSLRAK